MSFIADALAMGHRSVFNAKEHFMTHLASLEQTDVSNDKSFEEIMKALHASVEAHAEAVPKKKSAYDKMLDLMEKQKDKAEEGKNKGSRKLEDAQHEGFSL